MLLKVWSFCRIRSIGRISKPKWIKLWSLKTLRSAQWLRFQAKGLERVKVIVSKRKILMIKTSIEWIIQRFLIANHGKRKIKTIIKCSKHLKTLTKLRSQKVCSKAENRDTKKAKVPIWLIGRMDQRKITCQKQSLSIPYHKFTMKQQIVFSLKEKRVKRDS